MDNMTEVRCDLCGEPLGYQSADVPVDPELWRHSRCPVRLAEHWGIGVDVVLELTDLLSAAIASCYPEIPGKRPITRASGTRQLSKLRGDIAAGHAMELLAANGFQVRRQQ